MFVMTAGLLFGRWGGRTQYHSNVSFRSGAARPAPSAGWAATFWPWNMVDASLLCRAAVPGTATFSVSSSASSHSRAFTPSGLLRVNLDSSSLYRLAPELSRNWLSEYTVTSAAMTMPYNDVVFPL